MTLFRLLTEGTRALEQAKVPDAGLDARQLLLAAFHMDMARFLLNRMQELPDDGYCRSSMGLYREMIAKRRRRMPLQQILGSQEFMGLEFYVNRHVLIPRQDTETLVELVLQEQCKEGAGGGAGTGRAGDGRLGGRAAGAAGRRPALLDLCTGSGCIALSLAVKGRFAGVTATDLSKEALEVARRNARQLLGDGTQDTVVFYQGDLFAALPQDGRKYDVITSNPPYIPTGVIAGLEPEVRDYEPLAALDGSRDGLAYYRRIAAEAGTYMADGGAIYLEVGSDQGMAVRGMMEDAGYENVRVCKDLAGNDRVVCAAWRLARCPRE